MKRYKVILAPIKYAYEIEKCPFFYEIIFWGEKGSVKKSITFIIDDANLSSVILILTYSGSEFSNIRPAHLVRSE